MSVTVRTAYKCTICYYIYVFVKFQSAYIIVRMRMYVDRKPPLAISFSVVIIVLRHVLFVVCCRIFFRNVANNSNYSVKFYECYSFLLTSFLFFNSNSHLNFFRLFLSVFMFKSFSFCCKLLQIIFF